MEHRQQHGNADAPGQCIRRADEQRHGGVDHAALREGQVHTKVGGIGVAAAAGGAKLLVVQPHHGCAERRQRPREARVVWDEFILRRRKAVFQPRDEGAAGGLPDIRRLHRAEHLAPFR